MPIKTAPFILGAWFYSQKGNRMKTLVLHHDDEDGYGSAAAYIYSRGKFDAKYIPVQYNEKFPYSEIDKDTNVIIVDFSYKRDILEDVDGKVKSLLVLDHHKTAAKELEGLPYVVFDMKKSGTEVTWEYFNPGIEMPEFLFHLGRRDVWNFTHPDTDAMCEGFKSSGKNKDLNEYVHIVIEQVNHGNKLLVQQFIEKGRPEVEKRNAIIASKLKKVKIVNIEGFKVGVINAPDLQSELGNTIAKSEELNVDFAMMYFMTQNSVIFSFRSIEGKAMTGPLCKELERDKVALSGGGHDYASGCVFPVETGLKLIQNILQYKEGDRIRWEG